MGWNRKGQANGSSRTGKYLRIDAYHLAVKVKQWPAGITGVDGHICLEEGDVVLACFSWETAAFGTDYPGSN